MAILKSILLTLCLLALLILTIALPKGNPYYLASIRNEGRSYYLVYHHDFATNYAESRLRCQSIPGGDLADITDEKVLDYLSDKLSRPAFIKSFNGTAPQECMAMYPGSIIAGKILL